MSQNESEISNLFAEFFSSVFCGDKDETEIKNILDNLDETMPIRITEKEVFDAMMSFPMNKGIGIDDFPPIVIRKCIYTLSKPITMLFNKSLSSGILPTSLKTSHVIPIYKKGPKQYVENYRSIATLPSLLKLFERIMSNKIMSQFEPLMNQNQHGFVPGRSINTNLMELITFATESFAEKCQVDVLYTDFSKAFDKVNHALLLKKMKDLSIDDGIIKWIASYLDARIMRVKINGNLSNPYLMKTGVPAGSILGPILFLIYINDLPSVISNYCLVLLFADDCKLIMRVRTIEDAIKFQAEIDKLNN